MIDRKGRNDHISISDISTKKFKNLLEEKNGH